MILFPKPGPRKKRSADPTAEEKRHIARVRALGCVCCLLEGVKDALAEAHHVRKGVGKGVRNHQWVIPLCALHHRDGPPGVAVHAGEKVWRWDEIVLLHLVASMLDDAPLIVGQARA